MEFFKKIFGGESVKKNIETAPEDKELLLNQVSEAAPRMESIPDYVVNESRGRTILFIPKTKFKQIGGRDELVKLFRQLYDGSDPAWMEDHHGDFAVETEGLHERKTFRVLKTAFEMAEELKRVIEEDLNSKTKK